jgi:hypothetical protein
MIRCVRSALVVCLFAASLHGQSRDSLLSTLQGAAEWTPVDAATTYSAANVENYSANLAPSLKRYGLKGITVQTWQEAGARVRMNLFEMVDAGAAYGFFSIRRAAETGATSPASPVGAESFQAGSRLYLWQGTYVVRIEGESESARMKMAAALSEKILGRSRKPPVSNHLPPRNLMPGSDKYILDAENVDRAFGVDPATLGFDDDVEVATASYRSDGRTSRLMLLLYPTQQIAKKYVEQILSGKPGLAPFSKRVGPLVAIVSGTDASAAQSILDDVNYETKVTWNKGRPNLGIAEIILTVFTFIGIGLLFTLVVGISFGGVRIFVKSRYPNRLFDRPEEMEIIQLKLDQGLIRKELGP